MTRTVTRLGPGDDGRRMRLEDFDLAEETDQALIATALARTNRLDNSIP